MATYARIRPPLPREIGTDGSFVRCLGVPRGTDGEECQSLQVVVVTTTEAPVLLDAAGGVLGAGTVGLRHFHVDRVFEESAGSEEVYQSCCRPLVEASLRGINATVLCYGQTGSGKTHTMLGDALDARHDMPDSLGLVTMSARDLLAAAAGSPGASVSLSYLQIYGRELTDLLPAATEAPGSPLSLHEIDGEIAIPGLNRWPIEGIEDVNRHLRQGSANRKVACTALNATSSRSHAIVTFYFERALAAGAEGADALREQDEMVASKLHCVDLAGSERVKDSEVAGQALREARQINLSLFHLARVVHALNDQAKRKRVGQVVPYKDDALCYFLKDALGGNCRTALVATISPAQRHASETSSTLSFAAGCAQIVNTARVNRYFVPSNGPQPVQSKAQQRKAEAKAEAEAATVLPWAGVQWGDEACPGGRRELDTGLRGHPAVSAWVFGRLTAGRVAETPLAVAVHGYPSSAEACFGHWLVPALVHAGFLVLALDFPGCGHSPGPALRTHSRFNLVAGGAADVVQAAIESLGRVFADVAQPDGLSRCAPWKSITLIGNDWGGGVALSMAHAPKFRHSVEAIVAVMPSYTETENDELLRCKSKAMLLWAKDDQMHPYNSKGKPLTTKLRKLLGDDRFMEYAVARASDAKWRTESRERAIIKFLTGIDYLPAAQQVVRRPCEEAQSTTGKTTTVHHNVVFLGGQTGNCTDPTLLRRADERTVAVDAFIRLSKQGGDLASTFHGAALGRSGGSATQITVQVFGRLPVLSPVTVTPGFLRQMGLWTPTAVAAALHLASICSSSPRYFPGREVITSSGSLGRLVRMGIEQTLLSMTTAEGEVISPFDTKEILCLNQRHVFALEGTDQSGDSVLYLEDGIRCRYSSSLARGKMCEIALRLCPLLEDLGRLLEQGAAASSLDEVRIDAVRAIRGCLDIRTFQREHGGRDRDRARYCKDDAAKFAAFGEGHCHTVSSTMLAFLYPFAEVLGLDVFYREDAGGHHQWLEFCTRPSMCTFLCDLYREDGPQGGAGLLLAEPRRPGDDRIPALEPKVLTGRPIHTAPVEDGDISDDLRPVH